MKKLYILILLVCFAAVANGQRLVSGQVLRTNGDTVINAKVYIYPDTVNDTATFVPMMDSTDVNGSFQFNLPLSVPVGAKFIISTLDCDNVSYITNNLTYAGININSNLITCVVPNTSFSGYVYLGSPLKRPAIKDSWVYLISKCPGDVLSYIDSVETDTNGYFQVDSFPSLASGCQLVMNAALKTTSPDYKKHLPAYHETATTYSLRWSGGKEISQPASKNGVIILLPQAMNPHGGPSVLAGHARDEAAQTRLPDKVIFITDMNDVTVDHTFTDANGDFAFTNLPFGTYKLFGDVWGKDNPDLVVTVDADHVNYYNIVFSENGTEFRGMIAVSVADNSAVANTIWVYPNPAQDFIYIQDAGGKTGDKTVTLLNSTGSVVFNQQYSAANTLAIPVQSLPRGVYILNIATGGGQATYRIVK